MDRQPRIGETRIHFTFLDPTNSREPFTELGSLTFKNHWKVAKVLCHVADRFSEKVPVLREKLNRCIFRNKILDGPGYIHADATLVGNLPLLRKGVIVQIASWSLADEKLLLEFKSVFVKAYSSSTHASSEFKELRIKYDPSRSFGAIFKEAVYEAFEIPSESLGVAIPNRDIYRFPWRVNALVFLQCTWHDPEMLGEGEAIGFRFFTDDSIVFVRDMTEKIVPIPERIIRLMRKENDKLHKLGFRRRREEQAKKARLEQMFLESFQPPQGEVKQPDEEVNI